MTTSKTEQAAGYLAAYLRSNGRFDLRDVADRSGVDKELEFLIQDILLLLEDSDYLLELQSAQQQARAKEAARLPLVSDWLRELTDRYFS